MKQDICDIADIRRLVDGFYSKIRKDELLGSIFNERIQDRWPAHLEKMYAFWETVLLGGHTYAGSPFAPHARLPVQQAHFDRWIFLFIETIDANFAGEKAEEAKWRAAKMAGMFSFKISYFKDKTQDFLT